MSTSDVGRRPALAALGSQERLASRWALRDKEAVLESLLFFAIAGLFAWATVFYPLGADQAIHAYVGRAWVLDGAVPYKDAFDYKPPGIFAIYGVLVVLFGEQTWAIRVFEIATLGALSYLAAFFTTSEAGALRRRVTTATFAVMCVLDLGFFDFWSSGQCELPASVFATIALVVAARVRPRVQTALLMGTLTGLAILMKAVAAPIALVGAAVLLGRASRNAERLLLCGAMLAGIGAPWLLTVGWFARAGALSQFWDVITRATWDYVHHGPRVTNLAGFLRETWGACLWFFPLSLVIPVAGVALLRGSASPGHDRAIRRQAALVGLALVAGAFGVITQCKFYLYHWGLLLGPSALFVALLAREISTRGRRNALIAAVLLVGCLFFTSGKAARDWLRVEEITWRWVTGRASRADYASAFEVPILRSSARDQEATAAWVATHTRSSDRIAMRGFFAQIYVLAHRRAASRFFWTVPLVDPRRPYRQQEYIAEDERALVTTPPLVVIVHTAEAHGLESEEYYTRRGYVRQALFGQLAVLQRAVNPSRPPNDR